MEIIKTKYVVPKNHVKPGSPLQHRPVIKMKYYMLNVRNRTAMEFVTYVGNGGRSFKYFTMVAKDDWLYSSGGRIRLLLEIFKGVHPDVISILNKRLDAFLDKVREEEDLRIVDERLFKIDYHEFKVIFNSGPTTRDSTIYT